MKLFEIYQPEDLENYASRYEDMSHTGLEASDFVWKYQENLPVSVFTEPDYSVEDWKKWFKNENDMIEKDIGHRMWDYLLGEMIEDPIVVVIFPNKKFEIWDGYHRIGATFVSEKETVPAVIGTPKNA